MNIEISEKKPSAYCEGNESTKLFEKIDENGEYCAENGPKNDEECKPKSLNLILGCVLAILSGLFCFW